jgi:TolB protein
MQALAVLLAFFAALGGAASVQSAHAAFPGRNGLIAFDRNPSGQPAGGTDIFTMKPNGTGIRNLGAGLRPSFSADGKRIAFEHVSKLGVDILVMRADGTGKHQLTHDKGSNDYEAAFSPNGKRVAFIRRRGGDYEIFVVNTNGTHERPLTHNSRDDDLPTYAPSGKRIAFHQQGKVFVMRADGSHQRALARGTHPNFSPNGKRIAFVRQRNGTRQIFVMRADGTHQHQLTHSGRKRANVEPAFSPNGRKIAYEVDLTKFQRRSHIFVMKANGTQQHSVTQDAAPDKVPDWGTHP